VYDTCSMHVQGVFGCHPTQQFGEVSLLYRMTVNLKSMLC